ncbi:MAG: hypothetical protein EBS86_14445 [Crocinitomicaceae bacterium]|nr:hypothetical protein [Crocinitomicaceae bacterium]
MENTKAIVDYAYDDNAKEMRDALYSDIQNRVMAHLDAKKQEIAQNMLRPVEDPLATAQDVAIEPSQAQDQEQEQEIENA